MLLAKFSDMNPAYTNLFSYEIENIVVVVPNHVTSVMPIRLSVILSLPLILVNCVLFRMLFRVLTKSVNRSWADAFFDSFGTLIAAIPPEHIKNRPERVMHGSVLLLTIITTNLVTAIVFEWLLAEPRQFGTDSFEELYQQKTPLMISEFLYTMRHEFLPTLQ